MTNKVYNVKIIKCYLIYEDPRVQVYIVDFSSRDCQNQFRGVRPGSCKFIFYFTINQEFTKMG